MSLELVIAIIVLLVSSLCTYGLINLLYKVKRLTEKGIKVEGIIKDLETTDFDDRGVRYPVVRFSTRDGVTIEGKNNIGVIFGNFKKGQMVEVCYNPKNPNEFIISSFSSLIFSYVGVILGIVAIIVGVVKIRSTLL